ncbi:hypothetical protein SMCF_3747, partial [Streptomyces coelicoflavus ZG0656]
ASRDGAVAQADTAAAKPNAEIVRYLIPSPSVVRLQTQQGRPVADEPPG